MYRSEEEIKRDMLNNIKNTEDKTQNSLIHDAISPASMEFANFNLQLEEVQNKLDIENLFGEELERFIYPRTGQTRKLATKAITTVIISGQEGSKIKKGDLVSSDTVNFTSLEERIIDVSGQTTVIVSCEEFGSIGNVPANSITRFPTTIPGLIDVYNPNSITNGYDEETDDELRQRYYTKLQRPGKAGNKYHYLEWAKEVVGVGDARVTPRWNGPLTIKVAIINSHGLPADVKLVDDVIAHIENERPFGADVTVVSATGKVINITTTLTFAEGYIEEKIIENIKTNISKYLKQVAFKVNVISYARIGSIIIDTSGVLDYANLLVNNTIENITITDGEAAVMGGVNE